MIDRVLATIVLAVCAIFLLRLLMGERRRYRLDSALRRNWLALKRVIVKGSRWRSSRREAARVAEEAIRRASRRGDWEGNVNTPKSFRKPPHDKMH